MELIYDKSELTAILNDFHNITGLSVTVHDANLGILGKNEGMPSEFCTTLQTSEIGYARCNACDKALIEKCRASRKPETHICHSGLTDMVIPIISNNTTIAFVVLGQIKNCPDFAQIYGNVADLELNKDLLSKTYDALPLFDKEKIDSIRNIVVILTEHILFMNMFKPRFDAHTQATLDYIDKNIDSPISIANLCDAANISKSVLYKNFSRHLGMSPNQYINTKKINKAKELIKKGEASTKEIAVSLGFANINYFYNLFKKITGLTPQQFKKI